MDLRNVFELARERLEEKLNTADKEKAEDIRLDLRMLDLYTDTRKYKEEAFIFLTREIEEDHLIFGNRITHELSHDERVQLECTHCHSTIFNVLDEDYVELYQKHQYCIECAMCGTRKWYRFDKMQLNEVTKIEDEDIGFFIDSLEEAEGEIECQS